MRTHVYCAFALLCGAPAVHAQAPPGYANHGYARGYPTTQAPFGHYGASQGGTPMGQSPYRFNAPPTYVWFPPGGNAGIGNTPLYTPQAPANPPVAPPIIPASAPVMMQGGPAYPVSSAPPVMMQGGPAYPVSSAPPGMMPGPMYPGPGYPMPAYPGPGYPMPAYPGPGYPMPAYPGPASVMAADVTDGPEGEDPEEPEKKLCPERVWVNAGFNVGIIRPMRVNTPLVTTGSVNDANPGALGQPGTGILFGDPIEFGAFTGVRGEIGGYLDADRCLSLEWIGYILFPEHEGFFLASDPGGNPLITRPFLNILNGQERAFFDAFPGAAAGSVMVDASSEYFSSETNLRFHFFNDERNESCFRADALVGFRYLRLAEELTIQDQLRPLINNLLTFEGLFVNAPNSLMDIDSFQTRNEFYGGQIGTRVRWEGDWITFGMFAKAGLGATTQNVNIAGSTTLISPAGNQTSAGGILALPSNSGQFSRTVLGFVPEGGMNLVFRVRPHVQLMAGYSFLFWNRVARPGEQIDRNLNPNLVPTDASFGPSAGPAVPAFGFNDDYFWVHNITAGLGLNY